MFDHVAGAGMPSKVAAAAARGAAAISRADAPSSDDPPLGT